MLNRTTKLVVGTGTVFFASLLWLSAASAQSVETQTAENGGVYTMPAGDYRNSAGYVAPAVNVEIPRPRIPMGDAALAAAKSQASGAAAAGVVTPPLAATAAPDPLLVQKNCTANAPTGFAPPDIHGAVSTKRLVVVTNVDIGIYRKTNCTQLSFVSLKSLFSGFTIPTSELIFDPKVIWDPQSKRFFVTAESRNTGNTDQFLYFAVSTDQKATAWKTGRITLSRVSTNTLFCKNSAADFYDYPSTGVNRHRWFVTSNNFPAFGSAYGTIISIDKAPTLSGLPASIFCHKNLNSNIAPPIVWDLNRKATFLSPRSTTITRYQLKTNTGSTPDTFTTPAAYSVLSWTAPPDCAQPNGEKLDTLDGRFQSASIQYRGQIWNVHTVKGGSATTTHVKWYRLKIGTAATVKSDVRFASFHGATGCPFNPSFATSNKGSAFITLSETSSGTNAAFWVFKGLRTTNVGWTVDVPAVSTIQFTGCNSQSRGSCRWGDYSAAQIDPSSAGGRRMWGCNELTAGTSMFSWATRCARIKR